MLKVPAPNFTQAPNSFFDDMAKTLKEGELRVLLVIMRQTFGWQKAWDRISLSQLQRKTGMCRDAVVNALKTLIEKRIIQKRKEGSDHNAKCWYTLVVEKPEEDEEIEGDGNEPIEDSNNNYWSSKTTRGSRLKRPTKETLTKEREKKVNKEKLPRSARQPAASPIYLNKEIKKFEGITDSDIKTWQEAFPAVNIRKEIIECQLWALSVHRNNYRKSLDKWMSNVNKSNTTPFQKKEQIAEGTPEDREINKNLAEKWENGFSKNGGIHYAILATSQKVTFVMPNDEGYSINYNIKKEEFEKQCQKALIKMKLKSL